MPINIAPGLLAKIKQQAAAAEPPKPAVEVANPEPQPVDGPSLPWNKPKPNGDSVLKALDDLWHERRKGKLHIVSHETGRQYEVLEYDGNTGRAVMITMLGVRIEPKFSAREEAKYYPVWT